ncbi:MAG: hypothetical protein JW969_08955 [Spirochaetales bacterium]|nr:hypothetical protein [Spirochaetales bacterium]
MRYLFILIIIIFMPLPVFSEDRGFVGEWEENTEDEKLSDIGKVVITLNQDNNTYMMEILQPGYGMDPDTGEIMIAYMNAGSVALDPIYDNEKNQLVVGFTGIIPSSEAAKRHGNKGASSLVLDNKNFKRIFILKKKGGALLVDVYYICNGLPEYNKHTSSLLY